MAENDSNASKGGRPSKGIIQLTEEKIDQICQEVSSWGDRYKLKLFRSLGVGSEYYTCQRCGRILPRDNFYKSTEPGVKSKITNVCKECTLDIVMPVVDNERQQPTKESVDKALRALNKPMLESVWDSATQEVASSIGNKTGKANVWGAYIKNIQMQNYFGMTYEHSDGYRSGNYTVEVLKNREKREKKKLSESEQIYNQFEKNKADTIRLIGYLPFEQEKLTDQPFMYAQLIGFLDSSPDGNDDMMRTQSIISIIRGFSQVSKIDDEMALTIQNPQSRSMGDIRALAEIKKNIQTSITNLAAESCISLKNSKGARKGENTWTGKLKRIKDMNLRDSRINGYQLETCKGMQQVADISMSAIVKSLHMDESEWSDLVAQQRQKISELTSQSHGLREAFRILLQENLDLRDTLTAHGLLKPEDLEDLDQLINTYVIEEANDAE